MPGIVVFRRRWMVASDDFVIPFGIAFVLRGIWMMILCMAISIYHGFIHSHMDDNPDLYHCEQTMDYFIGGYLALLFATNIMEFSVAWMSAKGSIMETEPRGLIPYLLYVRLILSIIEVVWLSLGVKWIFVDAECDLTPDMHISRAIIIFNWGFLFVVTVIIFCVFDSAGRSWFRMQRAQQSGYGIDMTDTSRSYSVNIAERYEQRWRNCFRLFCCRIGEGRGDENVYTFIGRTLSEYFENLDVVPSDFAAGLVLLRRQQKLLEQRELQRAIEEERISLGVVKRSSLRYQKTNTARPLRLDEKLERDLFKDVVHYMNYALAAYGWPVYMKSNVICGFCNLGRSFRCCYGCRKPDSRPQKFVDVEDDNCCRCHFSALKVTSGLQNTDVVYVSYHNELYRTPFYVALDHDRKSIVVTIRGTLSLQDILTDFTVEAERIPVEGGSPMWFGHKGMVRAAVYIKKKLIEEGILSRAFKTAPERGSESYKLMLIGHSLGAGTASILAFMLRPMFKDLFCYAYSPPGANMSLSAARFAKEFTISIIVGKDMIPRLSLFTLEDLRNKIMAVISHCREPKWKILRGCACRCVFCCGLCGGSGGGHTDLSNERERLIPLPDNKNSKAPRFYPPGKIIHIVKTVSVSRRLGKKRNQYEPVWAEADDFQSILISSLMWADHMPDSVLEVLNKCLPTREQEIEWVKLEREQAPCLQVPGQRSSRSFNGCGDPAAGALNTDRVAGACKEMSSKESFTLEVETLQRPSSLCSIVSARAPIARPESGIDDSDIEEKSPRQRISRRWENFRLSLVEQSSNSLDLDARLRSSTNERLIERCQTLPSKLPNTSASTSLPGSLNASRTLSFHSPRGRPPKKPPRTFATELADGQRAFNCKPPAKPPRTFEHNSEQDLNSKAFSSLDWDFPYSRKKVYDTPSQSSFSRTGGSDLRYSDGAGSSPYSPHSKKKFNSEDFSSTDQLKDSLSLNSALAENEQNSPAVKSTLAPYSPHSRRKRQFFTHKDSQSSAEFLQERPLLTVIDQKAHIKTSTTDSGMSCSEGDRSSPDSGASGDHDFDTLCWSCADTAGIAIVTEGSCKTHEHKTGLLETVL